MRPQRRSGPNGTRLVTMGTFVTAVVLSLVSSFASADSSDDCNRTCSANFVECHSQADKRKDDCKENHEKGCSAAWFSDVDECKATFRACVPRCPEPSREPANAAKLQKALSWLSGKVRTHSETFETPEPGGSCRTRVSTVLSFSGCILTERITDEHCFPETNHPFNASDTIYVDFANVDKVEVSAGGPIVRLTGTFKTRLIHAASGSSNAGSRNTYDLTFENRDLASRARTALTDAIAACVPPHNNEPY
jgi:hypothetical protein